MATKRVFTCLLFFFSVALAQEASALLEALSYVPQTETTLMFTDLALIKRYEMSESVTGSSSEESQNAFFKAIVERQALFTDYELQTVKHATLWGWNAADARWIVTLSSDAPLNILALRNDLDMSTLTVLLKERNFTATLVGDAILYQSELDLTAEWFQINLKIVNVAVLEEEKIIIMSPSEEAVRGVLEAHASNTAYAAVDSIQTITEQLGETATVILETNNCAAYGTNAIARQMLGPYTSPENLEKILERLKADLAEVSPYQTLALAYRYEEAKPLGTIIFNYNNTTTATNDLAARQKGAQEGMSFAVNKPYRETAFTLESAVTEGNNLMFRLLPFDNKPSRLFQIFFQRDMAFAGC